MELSSVTFFQDVDNFSLEVEKYSRDIFTKCNGVAKTNLLLGLYIGFVKSVAKNIVVENPNNSDLYYKIGVSLKSVRLLFPYFFTSIKGFYDEANIFIRNFVELSLILIDIGYNEQSLIFWKNGKAGEFSNIKSVIKRIETNMGNIPVVDQKATEYFKRKYYQISEDFTHELKLNNIEKIFRADGIVKFCDKASEEFTIKRIKSFHALILNAISLLIGVTNYSNLINNDPAKFSEANLLKAQFEKFSTEFELLT